MSDTSEVQPTKLTNSRSFRTWTTWSHRSPTSNLTNTNEKNPSTSRHRPRPSLSTAFLPLNATNGTNETLSTPTPLPYHSPLPSPPPPPPPPNAKRSKSRFSSITAIFRKRGSKSLSRESEFSGEVYLDMLRHTNKTKGDEGFGEQMTVVKSQSDQVSGSSMLQPLLSRSSSNGSVSECVTVPSNSTPPKYISQTRSLITRDKSAGRRHSFPMDNAFSSEGSSSAFSTAKNLDRVKRKEAQVRPTGTRRCDPGNHPENRNERPPSSLQWNPKQPDPFYSLYPFRHRLRPLWQLLLINRFLAALKRATEEEMDRRGSLSPTCSHQRQLAAREEELGEAYCSSSTNDPLSFSTTPDPFRIPRTLHSPSPTWIATLQAQPWPPPMPPLNHRRGNNRPSCMNPKRRSYTPPKELGAVIGDMDNEIDSGSYGSESATSEDDDVPLGILQSELHRDSLPLPLLKHRTTHNSSPPLPPPAYSFTSTRKTISTTLSSSSSSRIFAHGQIDPRPHSICWDTLSTTSSRDSNRTLVNTETSDLYSGTRRKHSSRLKSSDARGSSPRPWPQTSGTSNYRQGRRRSQPLVTF